MKIQYKNDTPKLVNIRGKKMKPGESVVSHVFIKAFEDDVKNGNLTVYVDGVKIGFEDIPDAEARMAEGGIPAAGAGGGTPEAETGEPVKESAGQDKNGETPKTSGDTGTAEPEAPAGGESKTPAEDSIGQDETADEPVAETAESGETAQQKTGDAEADEGDPQEAGSEASEAETGGDADTGAASED